MTDTIYSGSVIDFRAQLVRSAHMWEDMRKRHDDTEKGSGGMDAWLASVSAGNYAYTLAAVLGVAEREFGHDIAARLACVADDVLINGDDHDRNADVNPDADAAPQAGG